MRGPGLARTRMVVIGGDAAGMSAAAQARKRRKADDLQIVAFERGPHTSYSACGLPYLAGGIVEDWHDLVVRSPESFAELGIDARIRHEAEAIDLDNRRITVRDLEHDRSTDEPFDILVVATGSEPLRPPIPGIDLPGVYGLSILQDGIDLRAAIDAGPGSAVVIGGGYIGLEAAEALFTRGVKTTLIEQSDHVMARIDTDMAKVVAERMVELGIGLRLG